MQVLVDNSCRRPPVNESLRVLGRERWDMPPCTFLALASVFACVYYIIALYSSFVFFLQFKSQLLRAKYVTTVFPVYRMFFCLASTLQSLMYVGTTNVALLANVYTVVLLAAVNVFILLDTAAVCRRAKRVWRSDAGYYSSPVRNALLMALNALVAVLSVNNVYPDLTADVVPCCAFSAAACLLAAKAMCDINCRRGGFFRKELAHVMYLFMTVSASDALGLLFVNNIYQGTVGFCLAGPDDGNVTFTATAT